MSWRASYAIAIALFSIGPVASAQDQQLVEEYLKARGISAAVVRPITDDYVGRTFPNFTFFGVIFPQYPVAVACPQNQDLKCSNLFFVRNGQIDFVSAPQDLEFFFAAEMAPAPSQEAAAEAVSAWLRFSQELKQDLFYTFSTPQIAYAPRQDITTVHARALVAAGGEGHVTALMTLGVAGSLVAIRERAALKPGIRPICQATKLLDRDPLVRRMAEQDLIVMGRAAKSYLDRVRATARPKLQQAIDRIWQRILEQSRWPVPVYTSTFFTTAPCTSVSRKCRP